MFIKGFNHIGINTKDIERSLVFYRDMLGLELKETIQMDDCTIYYLLLPGGERIELFDYQGRNKSCCVEETQAGYRHIAIEVSSVDEYEALFKENGVPIVLSATNLPKLHVRVLLFEDPNGVVIEFCELLNE